MDVRRVTCVFSASAFFLFVFFFFLQLIRLWLQVCEEKEAPEKEMLARGSSPDPRGPPRGQDPRGH